MKKITGTNFLAKRKTFGGFADKINKEEFKNYVKNFVGSGFNAVVGLSVTASIFMGIANSVNVVEAYKEYGSMNVQQAVSSVGEVELLQGVKVFGDLGSLNKHGINKEALIVLDAKLSEYSSKSGNYVGVALFGAGSGCKSVDECKELNMKVKGLADGGVVVMVMDTGLFQRNVSVVADPAVKDFFSSSDEKYAINNLLIPGLKSGDALDGVEKAMNYAMGKLGSSSIESQRVAMAEQAKLAAEQARINEEKAKIEAEQARIQREEANKKMKELTVTTLKYLLMLAAAAAAGYGIHKGVQRVRIHFKKNSLFEDLDELETTEKVFEMMKANGDLTEDEFESMDRRIGSARSVIQNLDLSSYANNSLVLKNLDTLAADILELKAELDEEITLVNENKKTIDSDLEKKIRNYGEVLKQNIDKIQTIDNLGFSNVEKERENSLKEVSTYSKEVEDIKTKIASGKSLDFVTKKDFLIKVDQRMSDIEASFGSFAEYVSGLEARSTDHTANKKKVESLKNEDL